MNRRIDQAVDMGIGAGLMYFLDPKMGKGRRNQVRDQALLGLTAATDAATDTGRRVLDRATDVVPAAKVALLEKLSMDQELLERAKDKLGDRGLLPVRTYNWGIEHFFALLAAAALGAAVMYLLDPRMGRRRRAMMRDQFTHASREASSAAQGAATDLQNRAEGAMAEAHTPGNDQMVTDRVLAERVRSHLNGVTTHPGSINVTAHNGWVTLSGPILADEVDGLLARVRTVPGVLSVENHLDVHKEPGNVPGLQGKKGS